MMSNQIGAILRTFKTLINRLQGPDLSSLALCGPLSSLPCQSDKMATNSQKPDTDSLGWLRDPFLWGVPKKRRSIEVRLKRRLQDKYWLPSIHNSIPRSRRNIVPCESCGGWREAHALCLTCYDKIKEEDKAIHKQMKKKLGLGAWTREAIVAYQNETKPSANDKVVPIEMTKDRPSWWSRSLTERAGPVGPLEETSLIEAPERARLTQIDPDNVKSK